MTQRGLTRTTVLVTLNVAVMKQENNERYCSGKLVVTCQVFRNFVKLSLVSGSGPPCFKVGKMSWIFFVYSLKQKMFAKENTHVSRSTEFKAIICVSPRLLL